ncbi:hypothetical protein Hanom_Chr09g00829501 [Helianthus anomalus]
MEKIPRAIGAPKAETCRDDQWRRLRFPTGGRGSKTYIPKNFYRTGGSKTYIPKNFYTKATCITLLSEKFRGLGAPPPPAAPSNMRHCG